MRLCRSAAVMWECEGTVVRATAGAQQGQERRLRWKGSCKNGSPKQCADSEGLSLTEGPQFPRGNPPY